jgi:hypothetical protein
MAFVLAYGGLLSAIPKKDVLYAKCLISEGRSPFIHAETVSLSNTKATD